MYVQISTIHLRIRIGVQDWCLVWLNLDFNSFFLQLSNCFSVWNFWYFNTNFGILSLIFSRKGIDNFRLMQMQILEAELYASVYYSTTWLLIHKYMLGTPTLGLVYIVLVNISLLCSWQYGTELSRFRIWMSWISIFNSLQIRQS